MTGELSTHEIVEILVYGETGNVAAYWLDLAPKDMAERLIGAIRAGSIVRLHDAIY